MVSTANHTSLSSVELRRDLTPSVELDIINLRQSDQDALIAHGAYIRRLPYLRRDGMFPTDRHRVRFACDASTDTVSTFRIESDHSDTGRAQQVIRHRCDGIEREFIFDEIGEHGGRTLVEFHDSFVRSH